LGASKNHKVTNLENDEPAEAWEMHFFARNSRTDNHKCAGSLSWWSTKDPIIFDFHSNSHRPLSLTAQDIQIIFLFRCDTR
jgi:hypothetical protein